MNAEAYLPAKSVGDGTINCFTVWTFSEVCLQIVWSIRSVGKMICTCVFKL